MLRMLVTVLFAYSDYGSAVELNITCKECVNRKPTTAANIKREVGRKLRTPNVTCWNSLYDSMEVLVLSEVLDTKLAQNNVICMQNGIATLNQTAVREVTEQAVLDTSEDTSPDEDEEDDFFKTLRTPGSTATEGTNSTHLSNKMGKELESWCSEKQINILLEQTMFPAFYRAAWVDVFVKYNTAIPTSAAVERLFSQGSDIMKAKAASLTSDNFERFVFMKGNMDLLNLELSQEDSE
ncbi:hypothetical protein GWK47_010500 [Chionoecetes opilio]|uniref:HAT C-terminal dimerisation domain-containing protein n=1 Tax=Chionoecetes opilio TaxID=41210 RepID=A0A8J5CMZ4_CHIOP|nr:hypothetical protein GWK47_010500 [Chionoecetes opilio]